MLELKNVTKCFLKGTPNEHTVLNQVNLTLKKGDFVTIVGSNGAGKSTLFNAICGNFFLDQGTILLDGKDLSFLPEHTRAKEIGRVFQDPMKGTSPHMTIEENLALAYSRSKRPALGIALRKKEKEYFRNAVAEFHLGLEDRMHTKVGLLSGGQRQVITLLMCTLVPPKLLLLDEHTAALDPSTSEKIIEITKQIVKQHHLTTMMITHNMKSALEIGNRTIMMDSGQIILDISENERSTMTINDLLELFSKKSNKVFDNDRGLLVK